MNWAMITVIGTIMLGVSSALWVIFTTGKDKYNYHRHYTKSGFQPELPEDLWVRRG